MSFFPRPVMPAAAYADLRAFLKTRSRHQVGFAAASIAIPLFIMFIFAVDEEEEVYRPPAVEWFKTYDANRTDAQIKAQQKIDTAQRKIDDAAEKKELEARRAPFKKMDKAMDELGL
jgi:hypothetical protein